MGKAAQAGRQAEREPLGSPFRAAEAVFGLVLAGIEVQAAAALRMSEAMLPLLAQQHEIARRMGMTAMAGAGALMAESLAAGLALPERMKRLRAPSICG